MDTKEHTGALDKRISSFLSSQTNFTIAVSENNKPYCANCFYVYDAERNRLVFKSKPETLHISIALVNGQVAGTITPDVLDKTRIQGIQFTGVLFSSSARDHYAAKAAYYTRYPFALTVPGDLWVIELHTLKLTDNTLGFGTKLNWKIK